MMRGRRDKDAILQQSPKGESSSDGGAEQSNNEVERMIRREHRQASGRTRGVRAVVGGSCCFNSDTNEGGHRRAHTNENKKGTPSRTPTAPVGESVLCTLDDALSKVHTSYLRVMEGTQFCIRNRTGEHIKDSRQSIVYARTKRRRPDSEKWKSRSSKPSKWACSERKSVPRAHEEGEEVAPLEDELEGGPILEILFETKLSRQTLVPSSHSRSFRKSFFWKCSYQSCIARQCSVTKGFYQVRLSRRN